MQGAALTTRYGCGALHQEVGVNQEKSKRFLRAAVDGYESEGTGGEGETGTKARTLRITMITSLGGDIVASVFATLQQLA